jgi:hypothetical protein
MQSVRRCYPLTHPYSVVEVVLFSLNPTWGMPVTWRRVASGAAPAGRPEA